MSEHWPLPVAQKRRRTYIVRCAVLVGILVIFSPLLLWHHPHQDALNIIPGLYSVAEEIVQPLPASPKGPPPASPKGPLAVLRGPPTSSFKDNLRPDVQYITSWPGSGWTNDVMALANTIYLALLTQRVPILTHFTPSHVQGGTIDFGEVFDIPRLSDALGIPILEWKQVKDSNSHVYDTLGCWNIWEAVRRTNNHPFEGRAPSDLKLDVSYTVAPDFVRYSPIDDIENNSHATFWSLARLGFPEGRSQSFREPAPAALSGLRLEPDQHLLCYDHMYYVCSAQPFEFGSDYSPAWRFVARHMHWTPMLLALADDYVRNTLNTLENEETPMWISVHVRHGDFFYHCGDRPTSECFAPLSAYVRRVQEVKDELFEKRGLRVEHVIMTSDEKDPQWWEEVTALGWHSVDHSMTVEKYGAWYPVLIDVVIQSMTIGMVGTAGSTMSLLASRRVEEWHDGITRTVKWGYPGADDL